uniref:EGF-like domain-containing protein n=1 Tax=Chromera velia CCMP2878 TaxID=1169474 RepID=A0A0G4G588_9ALVE|eukprot:Cvel_4195.t1-p1 / transcript=Cvel_4195.t1 / gene=Cvel_4195 / organism=Chromera_velia_CCMP2878 / gene_product=Multiple epidermal growth factor-like domains, putative / transcript_product=Multiple epidermal growth factor-like domains, putative / location=Cvel_scaffold181:14117-22316(-) / protein_length=1470 / sequence_SO=supercontig / SO=protein_coding / is_pseudo=false
MIPSLKIWVCTVVLQLCTQNVSAQIGQVDAVTGTPFTYDFTGYNQNDVVTFTSATTPTATDCEGGRTAVLPAGLTVDWTFQDSGTYQACVYSATTWTWTVDATAHRVITPVTAVTPEHVQAGIATSFTFTYTTPTATAGDKIRLATARDPTTGTAAQACNAGILITLDASRAGSATIPTGTPGVYYVCIQPVNADGGDTWVAVETITITGAYPTALTFPDAASMTVIPDAALMLTLAGQGFLQGDEAALVVTGNACPGSGTTSGFGTSSITESFSLTPTYTTNNVLDVCWKVTIRRPTALSPTRVYSKEIRMFDVTGLEQNDFIYFVIDPSTNTCVPPQGSPVFTLATTVGGGVFRTNDVNGAIAFPTAGTYTLCYGKASGALSTVDWVESSPALTLTVADADSSLTGSPARQSVASTLAFPSLTPTTDSVAVIPLPVGASATDDSLCQSFRVAAGAYTALDGSGQLSVTAGNAGRAADTPSQPHVFCVVSDTTTQPTQGALVRTASLDVEGLVGITPSMFIQNAATSVTWTTAGTVATTAQVRFIPGVATDCTGAGVDVTLAASSVTLTTVGTHSVCFADVANGGALTLSAMKVVAVDPTRADTVYRLGPTDTEAPEMMVTGSGDQTVAVTAAGLEVVNTWTAGGLTGDGNGYLVVPSSDPDGFFAIYNAGANVAFWSISEAGNIVYDATSVKAWPSGSCAASSVGSITAPCSSLTAVWADPYLSPGGLFAVDSHRALRMYAQPQRWRATRGFWPHFSNGVAEFGSTSGTTAYTGLHTPRGVVSTGTHVYVADRTNSRIVVLRLPGLTYEAAFGRTNSASDATGIPAAAATTPVGFSNSLMGLAVARGASNELILFAADSGNDRVMQFSINLVGAEDTPDQIRIPEWSSSVGECTGVGTGFGTYTYETIETCKRRCEADTQCDAIIFTTGLTLYPPGQGDCNLLDRSNREATCAASTTVNTYRITRPGSLTHQVSITGLNTPRVVATKGQYLFIGQQGNSNVLAYDCSAAGGTTACAAHSTVTLPTAVATANDNAWSSLTPVGRVLIAAYMENGGSTHVLASLQFDGTATQQTGIRFEGSGTMSSGSSAVAVVRIAGGPLGTLSVNSFDGVSVNPYDGSGAAGPPFSTAGYMTLTGRLDFINLAVQALTFDPAASGSNADYLLRVSIEATSGASSAGAAMTSHYYLGWAEPTAVRCGTCNNNGVCDPLTNQCVCMAPYFGTDCSTRLCDPPCQHGGVCNTATGVCDCSALTGYSGDQCQYPDCPTSSGEVCGGRGECHRDRRNCVCNDGFFGEACEYSDCPVGTASDSLGLTCGGHGVCDETTGACACETGYFGDTCEFKWCGPILQQLYEENVRSTTIESGNNKNFQCGARKFAKCDTSTGHCDCPNIQPVSSGSNNYQFNGSEDCEVYECAADRDLANGTVATVCQWTGAAGTAGTQAGSYCNVVGSKGLCECSGGAFGWDCSNTPA